MEFARIAKFRCCQLPQFYEGGDIIYWNKSLDLKFGLDKEEIENGSYSIFYRIAEELYNNSPYSIYAPDCKLFRGDEINVYCLILYRFITYIFSETNMEYWVWEPCMDGVELLDEFYLGLENLYMEFSLINNELTVDLKVRCLPSSIFDESDYKNFKNVVSTTKINLETLSEIQKEELNHLMMEDLSYTNKLVNDNLLDESFCQENIKRVYSIIKEQIQE